MESDKKTASARVALVWILLDWTMLVSVLRALSRSWSHATDQECSAYAIDSIWFKVKIISGISILKECQKYVRTESCTREHIPTSVPLPVQVICGACQPHVDY